VPATPGIPVVPVSRPDPRAAVVDESVVAALGPVLAESTVAESTVAESTAAGSTAAGSADDVVPERFVGPLGSLRSGSLDSAGLGLSPPLQPVLSIAHTIIPPATTAQTNCGIRRRLAPSRGGEWSIG
jgi:hypothetical protein